MKRAAIQRCAPILLGALLLLACGDQISFAKVGFDSFSASQVNWFWKQVRVYANFEGAMKYCGRETNFEKRMTEAAQNCATPEAMKSVRAVFIGLSSGELQFYQRLERSGKKATICTLVAPAGGMWVDAVAKLMDSAVSDVANACRACPFC